MDHRGPIDLAFHPQFGNPQSDSRDFVYVFYKRADGYDVVSRFTVVDGEQADPNSELHLIEQQSSPTHAGGAMTFGVDGFLYIASGEERANDQKIDRSLLGGVFRIDVDKQGGSVSHPPPRQPQDGRTANYFIPSDNPFIGRRNALEEFYALGLRNPFTMSLDSLSGQIWIGEVGRNTWEEVNRLEKGANYEWSYREGPMLGDRMKKPSASDYIGTATPPVYSYKQSEGNNSIIGGFVYRGQAHPDLYGKYIFGDNGSSRIWAMSTSVATGPKVEMLCQLPLYRFEGVCGFGQDFDGEILICVLGNERHGRPSQLLRLVRNAPWPTNTDLRSTEQRDLDRDSIRMVSDTRTDRATETQFTDRLSGTGLFTDLTSMTPSTGVIPYVINTPFWSDNAEKTRWVAVPGNGASAIPSTDRIIVDSDFPHSLSFPDGTVFVKHFELILDENHPETKRRLETRVTVLNANGEFCGMTYRWNEQQTDAYLLEGRETADITIRTKSGDVRQQTWTFPDSADCRMCHNAATGFVLGVNIPQLNCTAIDPATNIQYNQLMAWNEAGLLSGNSKTVCTISEAEIAAWPRMSSMDDETASVEDRVRSYLSVNCSQCHRRDIPGRPPRPVFDLRFHIPVQDRGLIGPKAAVVAGRPSKSRLVERLSSSGHVRMPPIGRTEIDERAVQLVHDWIDSLD